MGETLLLGTSVVLDSIRLVLSMLDKPFYGLLTIMYQIFFNVSSFQFFNEAISMFFGRVQLIIGVYMMFQLAMTILKGIVDPDTFVKNEGSSKGLVPRIIISLLMLTLIMPVHTSGSNEFEMQISNQGLLFGTLSSLQNRIIKNNTLGRLILGISDNESNYVSDEDSDQDELKTSSRIFSSSVLKAFYRINLVPYDERKHEEGKSDDMINDNRICTNISNDVLDTYSRLDADPEEIIDLVNVSCTTRYKPKAFWDVLGLFRDKAYMFTYTPILSTIAAVVFVVILFSFTMDVVVRGIKLSFLRLLAPIPIISYMDPNGSKDNAFNSWWKTLTSTYIDLFVRISIVYFIIFIIQDMMVSGIVMNEVGGSVGAFSLILVYIGLFAFAKQAPKFIREVLGIKGEGGSFFSGLGAIGAAAGLIGTGAGIAAAIPGAIGSGIAHARGSRMADETRQSLGEKTIFGNAVNPDGILNRGKHLAAGIAGALTGGVAGIHAATTAKDHAFDASVNAMRQRNASAISRGNDGSTLLGTWGSTASNIFTGEGQAAADERRIQSLEAQQKALNAIGTRVSGEMPKYDWTWGKSRNGNTDSAGNSLDGVEFNYKTFLAQMEQAKASGSSTITVSDRQNISHTIDFATADIMKGQILQTNEDFYIEEITSKRDPNHTDIELMSLIQDAEMKGAASDMMSDGKTPRDIAGYTRSRKGHVTRRADYKSVSENIGQEVRDLTRRSSVSKANDQHSNANK